MKRLFKISAAFIAAGMAATLAGCAGCTSCAGCSGDAKNVTVTSSNWYTGTSYAGIQPSFILNGDHPEYTKESLVYDVTFDKSSASNKYYSVDYKDGSYSTEFYATYYNWNNSLDGYKTAAEAENKSEELVYCYKTQFNITVSYTLNSGEASVSFTDSVVSESYFRAAGKNLQPVYSRQQIKSASPKKNKPKTLADTHTIVDAVYENYYSYDCSEVTSVTTEAGKDPQTQTFSFKKVKNTVFDNSSLYIAVRSMKLSPTYSQTVSLFSAAAGGVSSYAVNGSAAALSAEERKSVTQALQDKGLYVPKNETDENGNPVEDAGVNSVAMNVNYTGGKLIGTTQTVWYAAVENQDNNTSRATMLKLSVPLSYNLGTLNYTLKQVTSTIWNG